MEYLKSDKWKAIAHERMKIDKYTCQMCGCRGTTTNPLEVHHLSYKHLYVEKYDAFEIDKYAIKVSEKNYPQIVHHGVDVIAHIFAGLKEKIGEKQNESIRN